MGNRDVDLSDEYISLSLVLHNDRESFLPFLTRFNYILDDDEPVSSVDNIDDEMHSIWMLEHEVPYPGQEILTIWLSSGDVREIFFGDGSSLVSNGLGGHSGGIRLSCQNLLFLDIETLGFDPEPIVLIGIANIKQQVIHVRQYFLPLLENEVDLMHEVCHYIGSFYKPVLVTFNGRRFDIPYLDERLKYLRSMWSGDILGDTNWSGMADLDLYVLFKMARAGLSSYSFTSFEREILGFYRRGDINGREVKDRYKRFQGSNRLWERVYLLTGILRHNFLDVVNLIFGFHRLLDIMIRDRGLDPAEIFRRGFDFIDAGSRGDSGMSGVGNVGVLVGEKDGDVHARELDLEIYSGIDNRASILDANNNFSFNYRGINIAIDAELVNLLTGVIQDSWMDIGSIKEHMNALDSDMYKRISKQGWFFTLEHLCDNKKLIRKIEKNKFFYSVKDYDELEESKRRDGHILQDLLNLPVNDDARDLDGKIAGNAQQFSVVGGKDGNTNGVSSMDLEGTGIKAFGNLAVADDDGNGIKGNVSGASGVIQSPLV
ncbi:MAG: ribonuclease H-like domain-containing protein, partial [Promethearchaeota archaeon]